MNAYHDLRSVRAWLNALYPDVPILVQRNSTHKKKSYFFLQDVREKYEDTGRGFTSILRSINIHLLTEGISPNNPGSNDAYWKTHQVLDFLRDKLMQERVIPMFLWNEPWFPPVTWQKTGGALGASTQRLAVTSIDAYDKESMLSSPVDVTVVAGNHLYLTITNWPMGRPMAKSYKVYRRVSSSPDVYEAIKNVPIDHTQWGATTTELTSFASLGPAHNPPTTSKQWMRGYLKVDMATCNMLEANLVDDAFHGYLNLMVRSRRPQTWKPAAPINSAPSTIEVV